MDIGHTVILAFGLTAIGWVFFWFGYMLGAADISDEIADTINGLNAKIMELKELLK